MNAMIPEQAVAAEGKNSLSVRAGIIESVWLPGSFVDVDDAKDSGKLDWMYQGPILIYSATF